MGKRATAHRTQRGVTSRNLPPPTKPEPDAARSAALARWARAKKTKTTKKGW